MAVKSPRAIGGAPASSSSTPKVKGFSFGREMRQIVDSANVLMCPVSPGVGRYDLTGFKSLSSPRSGSPKCTFSRERREMIFNPHPLCVSARTPDRCDPLPTRSQSSMQKRESARAAAEAAKATASSAHDVKRSRTPTFGATPRWKEPKWIGPGPGHYFNVG